jgi:hypothetical protein
MAVGWMTVILFQAGPYILLFTTAAVLFMAYPIFHPMEPFDFYHRNFFLLLVGPCW